MINCKLTNKCKTLQLTIKDYAYRLRVAVHEDWKIKLFREYYPCRFQELCMIHLSFLIDIPWDFIDQKTVSNNGNNHYYNGDNPQQSSNITTAIDAFNTVTHSKTAVINSINIGGATKSRLKRLWNNWRSNSHPVKMDCIPEGLANNIIRLIDCLDNDEACCVEGLFRKAGHTLRKRHIQEAVFEASFDSKAFQLNKYNFHDFASALKSVLIRLPTPLFTERLLPLFLQVAALRKFEKSSIKENSDITTTIQTTFTHELNASSSPIDDEHLIHLIESKQIKALRLLIQLLPSTNKWILKRLIDLLIRVKNLSGVNRMTSTCLGTIFGPVLLPQDTSHETVKNLKNCKQPSIECQTQCLQLNSITSLLIETGLDIFLLPYTLVQDICTNSPYLTIFKTDCDSVHAAMKEESIGTKENDPFTLLLSPQLRHRNKNKLIENERRLNDSPPLHTAIRFATATPTSIANFHVLHSPPTQLDDIVQISQTHNAENRFKPQNRTCRPSTFKWSRSVGEMSFDHVDCSTEESQHKIVNNTNNENVDVASTFLSESSKMNTNAKDCRLQEFALNNPVLLPNNVNRISPLNYSNYRKESLENLSVETGKRILSKKRRFTELRLPSSINRTGGGRSGYRRYLFSPCPPISLLPFKRVGGEKHNFHISPLSNFNETATSTALPSW
ncbi:Rho GTPase-activating protein isoform 2 [Schistosoma japonicum]|uniref:Rho GTPase-activating protein isoform 2 n=1 Tax=Schistosoma japonicum TaxID=6182 RepID=A0A4Z2CLP6_SCHJA|nr:Rho GTPase-activating protein isoform 2 [Schistosoma japonicum]